MMSCFLILNVITSCTSPPVIAKRQVLVACISSNDPDIESFPPIDEVSFQIEHDIPSNAANGFPIFLEYQVIFKIFWKEKRIV